jgi:hypothetical protein
MRKEHICNEPHPEDIETPSKDGQRNRLNHTDDTGEDQYHGNWFEDLPKFLQNH